MTMDTRCTCGHFASAHSPAPEAHPCTECACVAYRRATERKRLVKLVRSDVGKFLGADGRTTYELLEEGDGAVSYRDLLVDKLFEEGLEYTRARTPEQRLGELADIYEAVRCLALSDGIPMVDVLKEVEAKRAERGGFSPAVAMYVTTTAPTRHEGEHG